MTRPPNTYLLRIVFRSTNARLAADVANGIANSYLDHNYNIRFQSTSGVSHFMEKQMEDLRAKMERSSAALAQFEKELNVIDPEQKTSILSGRLIQLNTEFTSAQAERVRKEAAYNSMKSGSMDAAMISTQGEALKQLTEQSNEARQRFNEAQTHYGPSHPEYKKAASQVEELSRQLEETRSNIQQRIQIEYNQAVEREAMLKTAVSQTKAEFDNLNARSFDYQALKQEADGDKKLYDELFRKIKEAGINAGFQNSSVRLADAARPALKPVFPNFIIFLSVAFLASSFMAIAAAIIGDSLDTTIRDPEQVARVLKTEVIGTLPSMKTWRNRLNPVSSVSMDLARIDCSTADHSLSGYEEAIRTLRNSILAFRFRPPSPVCPDYQRLAVRRQNHRSRASRRRPCRAAPQDAPDRLRSAPSQPASPPATAWRHRPFHGPDALVALGSSRRDRGQQRGPGRAARRSSLAPRRRSPREEPAPASSKKPPPAMT